MEGSDSQSAWAGTLLAKGIDLETLASALGSIDEAVGIYDAEDRLVAFNRHYAEVRAAIGGTVELGVPWDALITASLQQGLIAEAVGREQEWLELRRRVRGTYSVLRRLPDGRYYQVNERRMPNGGIAVLWTDVTKLRLAEQALYQSHHRPDRGRCGP